MTVADGRIILGTSKVAAQNKITLVGDVMDELDLKKGDLVVFYKDRNGKVFLKGGNL